MGLTPGLDLVAPEFSRLPTNPFSRVWCGNTGREEMADGVNNIWRTKNEKKKKKITKKCRRVHRLVWVKGRCGWWANWWTGRCGTAECTAGVMAVPAGPLLSFWLFDFLNS